MEERERGGGLLEGAGGVDAVVVVVARLEGELGLRSPRSAARGRSRGQAEVAEDLRGDVGILDRGDDLHPVAAARAVENLEAPSPPQQGGPRKAQLPERIVGAAEFRSVRAITPRWIGKLVGRRCRRCCGRHAFSLVLAFDALFAVPGAVPPTPASPPVAAVVSVSVPMALPFV